MNSTSLVINIGNRWLGSALSLSIKSIGERERAIGISFFASRNLANRNLVDVLRMCTDKSAVWTMLRMHRYKDGLVEQSLNTPILNIHIKSYKIYPRVAAGAWILHRSYRCQKASTSRKSDSSLTALCKHHFEPALQVVEGQM